MNLFFDTSALVKIFHDEDGSQVIRDLLLDDNNVFWTLDIARIEYYSALFRRLRNKEIKKKNLEIAICGFEKELSNFFQEPTNTLIIDEAQSLLLKYGENIGLRTLDSLHLAAFSLIFEDKWVFVCCDSILTEVAEQEVYLVFNPIRKEDRFNRSHQP